MIKTSKIIKANIGNIIVILHMLLAYVCLAIPNKSYSFHEQERSVAGLTYFTTFFNLLIYLLITICLLTFFFKHTRATTKVIFFIAFLLSIAINHIENAYLFPWIRTRVHIPVLEDVRWQEFILNDTSLNLRSHLKEIQETIPEEDNWIKQIEDSYFHNNELTNWQNTYNSTIVLNENLKGKKLDDIASGAIFLFEGEIGKSFGNMDDIVEFAKENGYCYFVFFDGTSGRINIETGKIESTYSSLNGKDIEWLLGPNANTPK